MRLFRAWMLLHIPRMHPAMEDLLRCADGEQAAATGRHLEGCERCCEQVKLLKCAIEGSKQVGAGRCDITDEIQDIHSRILLQMEAWCSLGTPAARRPVRRRQQTARLSAALEFYFGKEAARRIECGARWSAGNEDLIPATKPLFSTFLGKRAAEALVSRLAAAAT